MKFPLTTKRKIGFPLDKLRENTQKLSNVVHKKGLKYPLADAEKELFKVLSRESLTENINIALESYELELESFYYRKLIPKESMKEMIPKNFLLF